ncbi:MAG: hypothetical protein PSU94_17005 [Lacunisphaera sp.]|nr:hypothetical protein [Lacunisphaera sp.]
MNNQLPAEPTAPPASTPNMPDTRWLVVINHHEARLFHSVAHGTAPKHILARHPDGQIGQSHSSKNFSKGKEKPGANGFFAPIAVALQPAGPILIFGSGTGNASEMDQLVAWLHVHHAELARRVVGTQVIDEHHLTDAQLLGKARDFYTNLPNQVVTAH